MEHLCRILVNLGVMSLSWMALSLSDMVPNSYADSLEALKRILPGHIGDWTAEGGDSIFDEESIFAYIDGAGEIYRAYHMRGCLARRYSMPGQPPVVLDIFDMGSSEDAFGVFTHDQQGEVLEIGQGALYRYGWLSFWKDRFFVSVYAHEETPAGREAILALGKRVASLISREGRKPPLLRLLPSEGLRKGRIRYFHDHVTLNYHFYLSNENILNLGPLTKAVLAEYRRGVATAVMLVVLYPENTGAAKAHAGLLRHYLPEAEGKGVVLLENKKWSGAATQGKLLAVVFDAHDRSFAESLIRAVMEAHEKEKL